MTAGTLALVSAQNIKPWTQNTNDEHKHDLITIKHKDYIESLTHVFYIGETACIENYRKHCHYNITPDALKDAQNASNKAYQNYHS